MLSRRPLAVRQLETRELLSNLPLTPVPPMKPTWDAAVTTRDLPDTAFLSSQAVNRYTRGGYSEWGLSQSLVGATFDTGIVGIDLFIPWKSIQQQQGVLSFTQLDKRLSEANALGLKVVLMLADSPVLAPAWITSDPNVQTIGFLNTNQFQPAYGTVQTGPVLWDPTYLAYRAAFIEAMGQHCASNPAVVGVTCGALNWFTDDWNLPRTVTGPGGITINGQVYHLNQVQDWLNAGYSTARMQAAVQRIIDVTAASFPHQWLKLEAGVTAAGLDGTATAQAAAALDYGYKNFAGRFLGQVNYLSGFSPTASDPTSGSDPNSQNYVLHLLSQHPGAVGLQMLGSATSTPAREGDLGTAVNTGLSYHPLFLEFFQDDATNPAFNSIIQQATVAMRSF